MYKRMAQFVGGSESLRNKGQLSGKAYCIPVAINNACNFKLFPLEHKLPERFFHVKTESYAANRNFRIKHGYRILRHAIGPYCLAISPDCFLEAPRRFRGLPTQAS